jgi:hypothetical protein
MRRAAGGVTHPAYRRSDDTRPLGDAPLAPQPCSRGRGGRVVVLEEWQVVLSVPAATSDADAAALVDAVDGAVRELAGAVRARLATAGHQVAFTVERSGG